VSSRLPCSFFARGAFTIFSQSMDDDERFTAELRQCHCQDGDGYLILGTFGGLVKFDGIKFTHIDIIDNSMLSNRILSLLIDNQQTLWIGTEGGGLTRFRNDSIRNFTQADGLDDEVVTALCTDRSGRLWIGTRNGIQVSCTIRSGMNCCRRRTTTAGFILSIKILREFFGPTSGGCL